MEPSSAPAVAPDETVTMRLVVTFPDRVGIVAALARRLADAGANDVAEPRRLGARVERSGLARAVRRRCRGHESTTLVFRAP
jgi:formyltetrahydrofolate hydrolase